MHHLLSFHPDSLFTTGDPLSHDLTREQWEGMGPRLQSIATLLDQRRQQGTLAWMGLHDEHALLEEVLAFAEETRGQYEDLVVYGIGGSALGIKAVAQALGDMWAPLQTSGERGGPRLFVVDNVDPASVMSIARVVNWSKALVIAITKSGGTLETMAGLLSGVEHLKRAHGPAWTRHVVTVTDPHSGFLRKLSTERGLRAFPVPPKVGGRFSVLTPVGTLPLALAGYDVRGLMAGQATVIQELQAAVAAGTAAHHAALALAGALFLLDTEAHRSQVVIMPYADHLRETAFWFKQLWAESIGKAVRRDGSVARCGTTPVYAAGATDQHSQIQLYMEGPADKGILFLEVGSESEDTSLVVDEPGFESLRYLHGRTLGELLRIEFQATRDSLFEHGKPNATFLFPHLRAENLGAFFATAMVATAAAGELYDINAFDQPGVEAAKIKIQKALLG